MPRNKHIQITQFKSFRWYNITRNTKKEIKYLRENFNFTEENLVDCLPPNQRSKILKYPHYIFIILLYPYYDRETREIKVSELDIFLSTNFVVTVHDQSLQPLKDFANHYHKKNIAPGELQISPIKFIHQLIDSLLTYCFPILSHINQDINDIEDQIFTQQDQQSVKDILLIKRNIVNFRKAMQSQKNVMKKMLIYFKSFFETENTDVYFQNLIEQTKDIWDLLENDKETINALYHSNESLSTLRLNEIMKTLTIFSVIIFPLTLFATLFSMKVSGTPFVNHPMGFWIVLLWMIFGTVAMLYFFKKKRWL